MKFIWVLTCVSLAVAGTPGTDGTGSAMEDFYTKMMGINARMSKLENEFETIKRENAELKKNFTRMQNVDIFDCYRKGNFGVGDVGTQIITFDRCPVDTTNTGIFDNPSSGIFTVTESGIYRFTFQAYAAISSGRDPIQ